jgi:hypothetical protein
MKICFNFCEKWLIDKKFSFSIYNLFKISEFFVNITCQSHVIIIIFVNSKIFIK